MIYQTDDGKASLDVMLENETVWLTQEQMATLYDRDRTVITRHIKNIFAEGELDEKSNVHFMHFPFSDKPVGLYNLYGFDNLQGNAPDAGRCSDREELSERRGIEEVEQHGIGLL